jgi:hypothetical protein
MTIMLVRCAVCTFCLVRDPDTATRESYGHIFYGCTTATNIIDTIIRDYFILPDINMLNKRKFVWTGTLEGYENLQQILCIFWDLVRYSIYKYKLKKCVPNPDMIKNEVFFNIRTSLMLNLSFELC